MLLTKAAIEEVKKIMEKQEPRPVALRVGVIGGGCSGMQYCMQFENSAERGSMDKRYEYDDLVVLIDATSQMYLEGATLDYVETLTASGFKFDNPQVKSTCGCGESFNA